MHVHGAAVAEVVKAPHLVEQLVAGVDAVGRGRKVVQKLHLLGRRVDLFAVDDQLIGVEVDDELVEGELLALGLAVVAGAAQHGVHACKQLLDLKGLDDVVVRTHLQTGDLVLGLALGGEHDDGHFHGLAQLAADLPAVHHGQHDIKQHEVGLDLLGHLDGLAAVGRVRHLKAILLQVQTQQFRNVDIVLHDEHFLAHVMLPPSPARRAGHNDPMVDSIINKQRTFFMSNL